MYYHLIAIYKMTVLYCSVMRALDYKGDGENMFKAIETLCFTGIFYAMVKYYGNKKILLLK